MRRTRAVNRLIALTRRRVMAGLLSSSVLAGSGLYAQAIESPPPVYHGIPLPRSGLLGIQARLPKTKSRWEHFEAEFGLRDDRDKGVTASIARAKYGLDLLTFSADALVDSMEDAVELRYTRGRICRVATSPSPVPAGHGASPLSLEDTRLKFDLGLAGSRPYLGVRLVIPFGD